MSVRIFKVCTFWPSDPISRDYPSGSPTHVHGHVCCTTAYDSKTAGKNKYPPPGTMKYSTEYLPYGFCTAVKNEMRQTYSITWTDL